MKFAEPHKPAQPITEIERIIYNLEQTEKFLLKTIGHKEHQLNEVLDTVKDHLKNGKKNLAKTYLRKKHEKCWHSRQRPDNAAARKII